MTLYKWSQTAASNANADPSINWQEGQAPSSVNDSARAMMASIAKHRDDIAGAIVTGGTATAYTVTSYEAFDTLARLNGQIIAFTPHATNSGSVTLNVDSLGAKPLRSAPSVELPAGSLIQGTPYFALYNNSDAVFYLHGGVGAANAYSIPLGAGMDYWGATAPSSIFALAQGQAISRTTYATLFSLIGTTYGVGNGSTTFNIPDKVGRVSAMLDVGSARISATYFGGNPANLGAVGGLESHTLTTPQIPAHSHPNSLTDPGHSHSETQHSAAVSTSNFQDTARFSAGPNGGSIQTALSTSSNTTGISINNANAGGGGAHNNVQPTIICNYIIRVL
ncbi:tail fiber protein [Bradyrhizobium sp. 200]|uniref:phage tail protein n=1 Tax=Bradyrhizobium sp. 200 TaxID=2782665 RepID=UPI001FFE4E4B|nr:tail fiber protein [Bradyrhizobium sp. 200]UPJ51866.1 tail fiber protein [Bradyrhizobium sp. 200]